MTDDANPFLPLSEMLDAEQFDELGRLFDESRGRSAGSDQWRLNSLAMLVECLRTAALRGSVGIVDTELELDVLNVLRALQAAYWLGKTRDKRRMT